jgi:hypothetical protein
MNNHINRINDGGTGAPHTFLPQHTHASARRTARSTTPVLAAVLGVLLAVSAPAADEHLDVGDWGIDTTTRTLPAGPVNTKVGIGTFTFTGGTGSLVVLVNATGNFYHVAKRYVIPMRNNLWGGTTSNTWLKVLPAYDTGIQNGNDFDLDIKVLDAVMTVRLRVSATDGANPATARIAIESTGVSIVDLNPTANAVVSVPGQLFGGSVLTQLNGRVGVNTTPAADAALDINAGDTKGFRIRPRSVAGSPASGTWTKGTLIVDSTGALWLCTANGTPGTWKKVSL